jgi:hypothetical protein
VKTCMLVQALSVIKNVSTTPTVPSDSTKGYLSRVRPFSLSFVLARHQARLRQRTVLTQITGAHDLRARRLGFTGARRVLDVHVVVADKIGALAPWYSAGSSPRR